MRTPVMSAAKGDKVGIPADDWVAGDEFHKAYLAKVAAVRDVVFAFVKRILPNADEWGDRIDLDTLEFMPTETLDTAPHFGEAGDLMCNFLLRFQ